MKNCVLILIALVILPILNRSYAQNNPVISFDTLIVEKYGQTFKNGVILDFSYQFVYPTNDVPEIKRIREQMIQSFFGVESPMSLEQAQQHYEGTIFHQEYASQQPDAAISHQYYSEYSGITINYDKVLVFYTKSYVFWGGMHGLEPCQYTCYDLQTGCKITLQDLFSNANKDEILTMIKHELMGKYYQEKAYLTENFLLLPKGIRFVYNPYQIASYGDGHIVVTLPLSKIRHLLKARALTYFEE